MGGVASYTVVIDGSVEPNPDRGTFDWGDDASDGRALGTVGDGGTDSYRFLRSVTDITLDGNADVYVNGELVNSADYGGLTTPALPNLVAVNGTEGQCDYVFTVTGDIEKSDVGSINAADIISGSSVDGGVDAYRFSGDITDMEMDGSVAVRFEYA
jgi:hypothetical protein